MNGMESHGLDWTELDLLSLIAVSVSVERERKEKKKKERKSVLLTLPYLNTLDTLDT